MDNLPLRPNVNPTLSPSVGQMQNNIDLADRQQLASYSDGHRLWFYVRHIEISLADVAWAALHDPTFVIASIQADRIQLSKSIDTIAGDRFHCIYFEDAYYLKTAN